MLMSEKKLHLCARVTPTLQDEHKDTFPMYKKKIVTSDNGDQREEFVVMSEDEKKNLRAASPFVECGEGKSTKPLPRDVFEVYDELNSLIDSLTPEEIEELKKLPNNE